MTRLAIIGAGELGQQLRHLSLLTTQFEFVGFFDDQSSIDMIIGPTSEVETSYQAGLFEYIVIGIGYKHFDFKRNLFQRLRNKIPFATLVHPSSIVDSSAKIGNGSCISAGVTIGMNVVLGEGCVINDGSIIAHDCSLGRWNYLSPGSILCGKVRTGDSNFYGAGCVVRDNLEIGSNCTFGMATSVDKNVPDDTSAVGNPMKILKKPLRL